MSKRSSTYVARSLDSGACMVQGCQNRAYYCSARMRFCALRHWRYYLVAKVVERQLLHSPDLALWRECIRMSSTAEIVALLALFGDTLVSKVDDIDRRSVDEIIRSAEAA